MDNQSEENDDQSFSSDSQNSTKITQDNKQSEDHINLNKIRNYPSYTNEMLYDQK